IRIPTKWFLFDIFLLIVFGVIALIICYESDSKGFLQWNCWLGGVATIGGVVYLVRSRCDAASGPWGFWLWINLVQTALALLALIVPRSYAMPPKLPWWPADATLALLSLAYLVLLLIDMDRQLKVLATV